MKGIPVVLVIFLIVFGISYCVDHRSSNDSAVVLSEAPVYTKSKHPLKYAHYEYLDSNLDGVVTEKEMSEKLVANYEYRKEAQTYQEYRARTKESQLDHDLKLTFVKSLNPTDRKLIEGLSFDEAKKAIHLPNNIKAQALSLDIREKAIYLKKNIQSTSHS